MKCHVSLYDTSLARPVGTSYRGLDSSRKNLPANYSHSLINLWPFRAKICLWSHLSCWTYLGKIQHVVFSGGRIAFVVRFALVRGYNGYRSLFAPIQRPLDFDGSSSCSLPSVWRLVTEAHISHRQGINPLLPLRCILSLSQDIRRPHPEVP